MSSPDDSRTRPSQAEWVHLRTLALEYARRAFTKFFGRSISLSDPRVENVAQAALVAVHRNIDNIKNLQDYLKGAVYNQTKLELRRIVAESKRIRRVSDVVEAVQDSHALRPETTLENQESVARVAAVLSRLPPKMYEVLVLRLWYGWAIEDIAERLNVEQAAVRKRISRALDLLRRWLEQSQDRGSED